MKIFFKKIILLFSLFSFFIASNLAFFASPAHAQNEWYTPSFSEFFVKVNDPDNPEEIFGERYTSAQVTWVIFGFFGFIFNIIPPVRHAVYCWSAVASWNPEAMSDCVLDNFSDAGLGNSNLALDTSPAPPWHKTFTNRPVSSAAYFRNIGEKLNIVPEAKAQGFGFGAANPVLEIWSQVRNVTYLFLIIVIIAMAFMIMFRVKLSPQTVISVQSALPKVVIALILITFSYAIAGFMIDLMYVVIGLVAAIIYNSGLTSLDWSNLFNHFTNQNGVIAFVFAYITIFYYSLWSALLNSGLIAGGAAVLSFGLLPVLITIIVLIAVLFASIKIIWMLVKTYVSILLLIITGPIQILLGTLGVGGFGTWLRSLMTQLAVYPTVGVMFFLSFLFLRAAAGDITDTLMDFWLSLVPGGFNQFPFGLQGDPLTSSGVEPWSPPLTIGVGQAVELLWLAASLGIYMLIPKAADIIKGFISGRPISYGAAIGAPLGAAYGTASYIPSRAVGSTTESITKAFGGKVARRIAPGLYPQSED